MMLRHALLFAAAIAAPASGQVGVAEPTPLPTAESSDDIVVRALRIPREELPTGVYWSYPSILPTRIVRGNSELFMRCALNISNPNWVRAVVDGEPNSATALFMQGRISGTNKGCYPPNRAVGQIVINAMNDVNMLPMIAAIDRGVIVERVLKAHAPDFALTRDETGDPAVRSRFNAREGVRNRLRLPGDRDALILAACLVREQPALATRLLHAQPGSKLERGLTQAVLIEARSCLQGARRVTIDPGLTRTYIADAYYRWMVAARGVDSLIPTRG